MSTHTLIDALGVAPQAWHNGGGTTRVLLTWPEGDDWRLRISLANIDQDGAFSQLPGIERWFSVVDGAGIELKLGDDVHGTAAASHKLKPGDPPLCFDGASSVACRLLDGPTRDLNLMLRGTIGAMHQVVDRQAWAPPPHAACGLFSAVAGHCGGVAVPAMSLLWFSDAPLGLSFTAARPVVGNAPLGWWLFATPAG